MIINSMKNRIYFNNDNKAYANISIKKHTIIIELIKVLPEYRNKHLATNLMKDILAYIKQILKDIKRVILSPLPLDTDGLKLNALMKFYQNFGFKQSKYHDIYAPYKMIKTL